MNVKDILSMSFRDIQKLNKKELAKIVTQLSSAANKRMKRFKESKEVSPAYRVAEKYGKFSGKGKNLNQLRAEYSRARIFMESGTGSLRKWNRIKAETVKTLENMGVHIPEASIGEVMQIYGKVKSEFPEMTESALYAPAIQSIYDRMSSGESADSIINNARNMMIEGYENMERSNNAFESGGVSGIIRG